MRFGESENVYKIPKQLHNPSFYKNSILCHCSEQLLWIQTTAWYTCNNLDEDRLCEHWVKVVT